MIKTQHQSRNKNKIKIIDIVSIQSNLWSLELTIMLYTALCKRAVCEQVFSYSYTISLKPPPWDFRLVIVHEDTVGGCVHFAMIVSLLFNGILAVLCENSRLRFVSISNQYARIVIAKGVSIKILTKRQRTKVVTWRNLTSSLHLSHQ